MGFEFLMGVGDGGGDSLLNSSAVCAQGRKPEPTSSSRARVVSSRRRRWSPDVRFGLCGVGFEAAERLFADVGGFVHGAGGGFGARGDLSFGFFGLYGELVPVSAWSLAASSRDCATLSDSAWRRVSISAAWVFSRLATSSLPERGPKLFRSWS